MTAADRVIPAALEGNSNISIYVSAYGMMTYINIYCSYFSYLTSNIGGEKQADETRAALNESESSLKKNKKTQ